MKAYLTKRYWFSASHRLHNEALSDEENRRLYGKCNSPYGHGHNYALEVTVSGPVDPRTGMICDLAELDSAVERSVLARFDHENLNTLAEFRACVPTSENLVAEIFQLLQHSFRAGRLEKVRLEETSQNFFEYAGGAESKL
ncbi:MAG: 6-carboxytetrahydropterin synthase [Terriglobales bacterium]